MPSRVERAASHRRSQPARADSRMSGQNCASRTRHPMSITWICVDHQEPVKSKSAPHLWRHTLKRSSLLLHLVRHLVGSKTCVHGKRPMKRVIQCMQSTRYPRIGDPRIEVPGSWLAWLVRSLSGAASVPAGHGDGCASRPHSYGVRSDLRASPQHAQGSDDRQKRARLVRVSHTGHPSVAQRCGAQRYRRSAAASAHILARVALPDRPRGPS